MMKLAVVFCLLLTGIFLHADNTLFNQPDNDNTCGIRQILIANHVLFNKQGTFEGDIYNNWVLADNIFKRNFSDLFNNENILNLLNTLMLTNKMPDNYIHANVAACNGGPTTMPSNVIMAAQQNLNIKAVNVYVNIQKNGITYAANGSKNVEAGQALIAREVNILKELGVNVIKIVEPFPREFYSNPNSYYLVNINFGEHWIGTTQNYTYDSLTEGPAQFDADKVIGRFYGIVIEFQKHTYSEYTPSEL